MKQTGMGGINHDIDLPQTKINAVIKDMGMGLTESAIIKKHMISQRSYKAIKTSYNDRSGPGSNKVANERPRELSEFKRPSGARKQPMNSICLCGTGKLFKDCCANKKRKLL